MSKADPDILPVSEKSKQGGKRIRTVECITGIPPLMYLSGYEQIQGIIHLNQIPLSKYDLITVVKVGPEESTVKTLVEMVNLQKNEKPTTLHHFHHSLSTFASLVSIK